MTRRQQQIGLAERFLSKGWAAMSVLFFGYRRVTTWAGKWDYEVKT
jgi:hypothetical protein